MMRSAQAAMRLAVLFALCQGAFGDAVAAAAPEGVEASETSSDLHRDLQELNSFASMDPKVSRALEILYNATSPGGRFHQIDAELQRWNPRAALQGRRLWFWPSDVEDPPGIQEAAADWVDKVDELEAGQIAELAESTQEQAEKVKVAWQAIQDNFGLTMGLLEDSRFVVDSAWEAVSGFETYLQGIYTGFGKVKPYFESAYGVLPLLGDEELMVSLIETVHKLLDSTKEVRGISSALKMIAESFNSVHVKMTESLGNITAAVTGGRRLLDINFEEAMGGIGDFSPNFDYSNLLAGMDFGKISQYLDAFKKEAIDVAQQLAKIQSTLQEPLKWLHQQYGGNASKLEERRRLRGDLTMEERRELIALHGSSFGRRLVMEGVDEIEKDKAKYEESLMNVVPTWRNSEKITYEACKKLSDCTRDVNSMVCRLENFLKNPSFPSQTAVEMIISQCDNSVNDNLTKVGHCPASSKSEEIRDAFSSSAGVIGWAFAVMEYVVTNNRPLGFIIALFLLFLGSILTFLGYYVKEGIEFCQGCCGGLVCWSMLFSFCIVWFDMCRGGDFIPDCDPAILFGLVLVLSLACGIGTWLVNAEQAELWLSGFTTGAFCAGAYYIVLYRDEMLKGFLDADSAKPYMIAMLIVMIIVGCFVGGLTIWLARQLLMMGSAVVGSFIIMVAILCMFPHWWSTADWIFWGILAVVGYAVQLLLTPPDFEMMDAEEQREYIKARQAAGPGGRGTDAQKKRRESRGEQ